MVSFNPETKFDSARNLHYVEGYATAFHCHHYMGAFFKMLAATTEVNGAEIMKTTAEKITGAQLRAYFRNHPEVTSEKARLEVGADAFRRYGLGNVDFSQITNEGGTVIIPTSHIAKALKAKVGKSTEGGGSLLAGIVAGILSAAYGRNYKVTPMDALAGGTDRYSFKVEW